MATSLSGQEQSTSTHSSVGEEQQFDDTSTFFKQIKRANSGPWLQKPINVTLAELEQSNHAPASTNVNANSSVSCVSTNTSAHLIGPNSTHSSISCYNTMAGTDGSQHAGGDDSNTIVTNVTNGTVAKTTNDGSQHDAGGDDSNTNFTNGTNGNTTNGNNGNHNQPLPGQHRDDNINNNNIQRHLSLFDLINIGVGGTIGSGIFVLCGYIAHNFAGPSTCISWAISGVAACLSGVCYAELACRIPAAGSSYVYVYASMGELPAVLVAACLSLEYGISASAVARSWGDKCIQWLTMDLGFDGMSFHSGGTFNPLATFIAAASVALLMGGVKESKSVTNFFTVTKVGVVMFMSIVGLILIRPRENLVPFIPPQYGLPGVFRGATSSFFGYIGFDEGER